MKILIADDEAPARAQLRRLIQRVLPQAEVVGEADHGEALLELYHRSGADLVLLDIRMPGMDGIETAKRLAEEEPRPAVIFCTAYDEHALQAFETSAIAYLLKPVRAESLATAIATARAPTRPQLRALEADEAPSWISAPWRGGVKRVRLDEVRYFKADSKYVMARHGDGELVLEESLKQLEERFPRELLRIHRNALIHRAHLRALDRLPDGPFVVRLDGIDEGVEVSRRHLPVVRRLLKARQR